MSEISVPIRLLYYLNESKKDHALLNIIADKEVFNYYVNLSVVYNNWQDAIKCSKKIIKLLKEAAK